jgi:membrane protein DedA with SNARE-associated domain
MKTHPGKSGFLLRNLLSGFAWLAMIILFFFLIQAFFDVDFVHLIEKYADKPLMVFLIFLASEVIFGIIPPEVFMIWAAGSSGIASYPFLMVLLAIISYSAGIIGYFLGQRFHKTRAYRKLAVKTLRRYPEVLRRYGGFLIIVASLTPLPFSAICMLVGAIEFPFRKFLAYAAFRFLRFTAHAWLMHHVSHTWFF